MFKLLLAAVLSVASLSAVAADYGIAAQYDYDNYSTNRSGLKSSQKLGVLVGTRTEYGTFDLSLFKNRLIGERFDRDTSNGVEVGYGNQVKVGIVDLSGRVAYGKVWSIGLPRSPEEVHYTSAAVTAGLPINKQLSTFVSYKRRFSGDLEGQNQYGLGAQYFFSKQVMGRATYVHNQTATRNSNGISTAIFYLF